MPVVCARCGEELLGSVNRCWRCGQSLVVRAGDADVPPIRRGPVSLTVDEPFVAELAVPDAADVRSEPAVLKTVVRRGSPFARHDSARNAHRDRTATPPPADRSWDGARVAATLAVVLALFSLGAAYTFPMAGIFLAIASLGFGIWGLFSRRRLGAVLGIVLSCLGLALSGFNTGVAVYESVYGAKPWESSPPLYSASP